MIIDGENRKNEVDFKFKAISVLLEIAENKGNTNEIRIEACRSLISIHSNAIGS